MTRFVFQVLGDQWTDKYFQQLSEVIEDSIKQGADGHDHYLLKLKDIHSDIVTNSTEGVLFFLVLFYHQKKKSIFVDSSTLFT